VQTNRQSFQLLAQQSHRAITTCWNATHTGEQEIEANAITKLTLTPGCRAQTDQHVMAAPMNGRTETFTRIHRTTPDSFSLMEEADFDEIEALRQDSASFLYQRQEFEISMDEQPQQQLGGVRLEWMEEPALHDELRHHRRGRTPAATRRHAVQEGSNRRAPLPRSEPLCAKHNLGHQQHPRSTVPSELQVLKITDIFLSPNFAIVQTVAARIDHSHSPPTILAKFT
jgi:hypothetical protein